MNEAERKGVWRGRSLPWRIVLVAVLVYMAFLLLVFIAQQNVSA